LRLVNWSDGFYTLDLDNHGFFDNQINAVTEIDPFPVTNDGQSNLLRDSKVPIAKFVGEAGFIRAFKHAGAEMRVNFHRSRDHSASDSVNARSGDNCRGGHCTSLLSRLGRTIQ
jgi:hypothetical protein